LVLIRKITTWLTLIHPNKTEERHSFERRMASVDEKKKQQVTASGSGCGTGATANIRTRPSLGPRGNRQVGVECGWERRGEGQSKIEASLVSTGRAETPSCPTTCVSLSNYETD